MSSRFEHAWRLWERQTEGDDGRCRPSGYDRTSEARRVTLAPGQTSTTVPVTITTNPTPLPNRSFTVTLGSCSTHVAVADATGTVTIVG